MRSVIKVLVLATVFLSTQIQAKTLVLAADLWCPYNCQPDSDTPGFMVEIARKVFSRHDMQVQYRLVPWSRAVQSARDGDVDAVIGATLNDAPDFVFPRLEQGKMRTALWAAPDLSWRYQGLPSLSEVVLGVSAGYSYGRAIDGYIADPLNQNFIHVLFGTAPLAQGLRMLGAGRIDVMVEDESVFRFYVRQRQESADFINVGFIENPNADTDVYIAFSPAKSDSLELAEMLSEGMASLRASGELHKILERYGLSDWRD
ncbi:transporter substrate-binding domain-containing protein [Lacimicrobium sp. SS2-24]|uniref:substrate-binding periplasmic protein n=1 Tax=Lacimicrobium sp. SS2-24 TaxID=2005569 RepID=UPI000B4BD90D|nr:transporter substrate-binding domain-containing protein [Lacimicrobium sp. SS2-24]